MLRQPRPTAGCRGLRRRPGFGGQALRSNTVRHLADSIVYLCALLADRPRLIDRYINYFGETQPRALLDGRDARHEPEERRLVHQAPPEVIRSRASAVLTKPA